MAWCQCFTKNGGDVLSPRIARPRDSVFSVPTTRNVALSSLPGAELVVGAYGNVVRAKPDEVRYVRQAFEGMEGRVHFAETSVNFDWKKMWKQGHLPS